MTVDHFASLPADRREVARSAVAATFGPRPIGGLWPITGGASGAFACRLEVNGRPYLLRVEGVPSPLRNPYQYASMRIAAEAGIAPSVRYADETGRVVIMDYIERRPLESYPGGQRGLVRALGELLARLQTTAIFPYFVDYPDIVARLFAHVRRTALFATGLLDPHVERLERVRNAYFAGSAELVSSHNDFHRGNVLFDGERLWLIDWESAYRNDAAVDVAIALDSLALPPEMEAVLLQAWLGRTPDEAVRARLELVRGLTRLYFAGVFLSASAAAISRQEPDTDLSVPSVVAFEQLTRDGRLAFGTREFNHVLGKMYLASFLSGAHVPGFGTVI